MFYSILENPKKRNSKSSPNRNNSPDAPVIPPEVPPGYAITTEATPIESHADGTYGKIDDATTARAPSTQKGNKSPQNLGIF